MVAVFLTFLSLVLTLVIGSIFLLGIHRLVTLVVNRLESRDSATAPTDPAADSTYWADARRSLRSLTERRPARR